MWQFKRKPESPQEIAAEERLDQATREIAGEEMQKEADRELYPGPGLSPALSSRMVGSVGLARFGRVRPFRWVKGDPLPEPVADEDPGGEGGLRDALREGAEEPRKN